MLDEFDLEGVSTPVQGSPKKDDIQARPKEQEEAYNKVNSITNQAQRLAVVQEPASARTPVSNANTSTRVQLKHMPNPKASSF